MDFTGERLVPTASGHDDLFLEHITRYLFASSLVENKTVLDAGCGCGYGSYHLARAGAASVLGIDVSEEAIEYSKEHYRHDGLSYEKRDVLNTGLVPASFDVVVSFEVFEHVADPEAFLDEMRRLLKPDGVLLLSTPNAATYSAGGEDGSNPFHVREYMPQEFREVLDRRFPTTYYYVQNPWMGLSVLPVSGDDPGTSMIAEARLVLPSAESTWGEPVPAVTTTDRCAYMVAVCSLRSGGLASLPGPRFYSMGHDMGSMDEESERVHQQISQLHSELDLRGEWGRNLEQELELRDRTIQRLQEEFEERTQWALDLDRQVAERDQLIQTLQKELSALNR
jgi:SAM-dependent methyltransferase